MPDAPSSPRARILVADDEANLRRIAEYRLAEAGYEVAVAPKPAVSARLARCGRLANTSSIRSGGASTAGS